MPEECWLFAVGFVLIPVLLALVMQSLRGWMDSQLPEKGRIGVWLSTFTLPVHFLMLGMYALIYKIFGRHFCIVKMRFPCAITPYYQIFIIGGPYKYDQVFEFVRRTVPLWCPVVIISFVGLCIRDYVNLACGDGFMGVTQPVVLAYFVALMSGTVKVLRGIFFDSWLGGVQRVVIAYFMVSFAMELGLSIRGVGKILLGLCVVVSVAVGLFMLPFTGGILCRVIRALIPFIMFSHSVILAASLVGASSLILVIGIKRAQKIIAKRIEE